MEKGGTLVLTLRVCTLSKGGPGTRVPKPEFIGNEPQRFFFFPRSETLPPFPVKERRGEMPIVEHTVGAQKIMTE